MTLKFQVFWDKLPAYQEFLHFHTLLVHVDGVGVVKRSFTNSDTASVARRLAANVMRWACLLMCFSPAMYCNVTDSWTMTDKWKRHHYQFRRHLCGIDYRRVFHMGVVVYAALAVRQQCRPVLDGFVQRQHLHVQRQSSDAI